MQLKIVEIQLGDSCKIPKQDKSLREKEREREGGIDEYKTRHQLCQITFYVQFFKYSRDSFAHSFSHTHEHTRERNQAKRNKTHVTCGRCRQLHDAQIPCNGEWSVQISIINCWNSKEKLSKVYTLYIFNFQWLFLYKRYIYIAKDWSSYIFCNIYRLKRAWNKIRITYFIYFWL